ncbi:hypothetical protein BDFB_013117, partial [Asbolus verrucosus]
MFNVCRHFNLEIHHEEWSFASATKQNLQVMGYLIVAMRMYGQMNTLIKFKNVVFSKFKNVVFSKIKNVYQV